MKKVLIALVLLTGIAEFARAATLSYEGKAIAQVTRDVSIPFTMLVDKVFASIGQDVNRNQRLLEYRLKPAQAKGVQYELMTGSGTSDVKIQLAGAEQELLGANSNNSVSSELAAKGLGSTTEASRTSRNAALAQRKVQGAREKYAAHTSQFAMRLAEFEEYFGQKLKPGQKLPKAMFLIAPMGGTIVDMSPQARPDGLINDNASAVTIAVLNPIQVQIQVYETEIPRLRVGQPASIELAGKPDIKLDGKISMLSWHPTDTAIAVPSFYNVHIDVDNPDHVLKPGYKVYVKIDVD